MEIRKHIKINSWNNGMELAALDYKTENGDTLHTIYNELEQVGYKGDFNTFVNTVKRNNPDIASVANIINLGQNVIFEFIRH